jgi:hypothetical protein
VAHFARVVDGIVVDLIVAESDHITNGYAGNPNEWIQTSYNTRGGVHYLPDSTTPSLDQSKALRKNFAGVGHIYDAELDAFYVPQPYPSWTLDTDSCEWQPPTSKPNNTDTWFWNEEELRWDKFAPEAYKDPITQQ